MLSFNSAENRGLLFEEVVGVDSAILESMRLFAVMLEMINVPRLSPVAVLSTKLLESLLFAPMFAWKLGSGDVFALVLACGLSFEPTFVEQSISIDETRLPSPCRSPFILIGSVSGFKRRKFEIVIKLVTFEEKQLVFFIPMFVQLTFAGEVRLLTLELVVDVHNELDWPIELLAFCSV